MRLKVKSKAKPKFNAKEYARKYRKKNLEKLRKVALENHYKRKKKLAEIRKKYVDY